MLSISRSILRKTKMTFYEIQTKLSAFIHGHLIPSFAYDWKQSRTQRLKSWTGRMWNMKLWPNVRFYEQLRKIGKKTFFIRMWQKYTWQNDRRYKKCFCSIKFRTVVLLKSPMGQTLAKTRRCIRIVLKTIYEANTIPHLW